MNDLVEPLLEIAYEICHRPVMAHWPHMRAEESAKVVRDAADRLTEQDKRIEGLERELAEARVREGKLRGLLSIASLAMNDGFHTGFCSGKKCSVCDNYREAMRLANEALAPTPAEIERSES